MSEKINISKEVLEKEYLANKKSCKDVARDLKVNDETIRRRLIEFGIKRRPCTFKTKEIQKKVNSILSKKFSREGNPFYGRKHTSKSKDIIGTKNSGENPKLSETRKKLFKEGKIIHPLLGKHHTKKTKEKMRKAKEVNLDIDLIKKYYLKEQIPTKEIGKKFGVCDTTIQNRLKKEGINLRHYHTDKTKQKIGIKSKEKIPYKRTKEHKKLMKKIKEEKWRDPVFASKVLKGLMKRPTSFEQKIILLCSRYRLPFIYTGDGRILIGYKNPDFVDEKDRIIIEVFLDYFKIRDYDSVENYMKIRGEYFARYGYKTIFINEQEITAKNWEEICLNKINKSLKYAR